MSSANLTVNQFLEAYRAGQHSFPDLTLKSANLQGCHLPLIDLSESILEHADFRKAILSGSCFIRARLQDANLDQANLIAAELMRANLQRASLKNTLLASANLCGADLSEANLQYASLNGANLNGARLRGANLRGVNLDGASLLGTDLMDADLRDVDLKQAKLGYTVMPDGYCLVGDNTVDDDPNKANVSLASISAYARLAKIIRSV
ncbi:MAG: pentapeptide repeat-containing protein [Cyanobacteria bacterium]|nr:pentapeptide repeat-containing protein [Cyanobacteriota bacterium]